MQVEQIKKPRISVLGFLTNQIITNVHVFFSPAQPRERHYGVLARVGSIQS